MKKSPLLLDQNSLEYTYKIKKGEKYE